MTDTTSPTSSGSSAEVGSSKSSRSGLTASARAMPTPLLLPAGEAAGERVFLVAQADAVEQDLGLGHDFIARTALNVERGRRNVLHDRHVRPQVEVLEHHADARAHAGEGRAAPF